MGARLVDGDIRGRVTIPHERRAEHIAVLGKTGTGKSSSLRYFAKQDIERGRGFFYFDLHGDGTPFLLRAIAKREKLVKQDFSERLILIDPADPEVSVGLNSFESHAGNDQFVRIAEFSRVLRERWQLDSLGARTDELLRNSLYVLADNALTILELGPVLTDPVFRATCVKRVQNPEVRQYFELRFDQVSEPMRATMREPILNKTSAFVADTRFRHIVGQSRSTFSLTEAMDRGYWVILNLHKGRLGEQSLTLGSLFFTTLKNTLFSRTSRELFTIYADEVQNLVAYGDGLETVLSESRKFGTGIISANQFLDQYPPEMRAAIMAVGTHLYFQLSSSDAQQIATALDGGKPLAETLKNLPRRHVVVKTGHERPQEAIVPMLEDAAADASDLVARCRARWARSRRDIEEEIRDRQLVIGQGEVLNDWD